MLFSSIFRAISESDEIPDLGVSEHNKSAVRDVRTPGSYRFSFEPKRLGLVISCYSETARKSPIVTSEVEVEKRFGYQVDFCYLAIKYEKKCGCQWMFLFKPSIEIKVSNNKG